LPDPLYVICNPHAGRGKGARILPRLLEALRLRGQDVEHALTRGSGDERALAAAAAERGHRTVAVVGGDGTWSNAAAGLLDSGRGQSVRLGLVAAGTGADLARSFSIPRDVAGAARVLVEGRARPLDAGRIEGRPFFNLAGFGYDVAVIEDTRAVRRLSGPLLYLYCALRQLRRFRGFDVRIEVDGKPLDAPRALMVTVSSGRIFGGGFPLWPRADPGDGLLEVLVAHDASTLGRLGLMQRLRRGRHHGRPGVSGAAGRTFRLTFPEPPRYETDGEWNQARTADLCIETLPAALQVLAPSEG